MRASYRVIQWATGSVGREALKAILMHPRLELAGVLIYSEEKNGKDAGELCGVPATGVLATNDKDAIVASKADCVVYAPRLADVDDVCALPGWRSSIELGAVCTGIGFRRANG